MRLRWFACALMVATAALAAPSAAEAQGQAVAPDSVSEIASVTAPCSSAEW